MWVKVFKRVVNKTCEQKFYKGAGDKSWKELWLTNIVGTNKMDNKSWEKGCELKLFLEVFNKLRIKLYQVLENKSWEQVYYEIQHLL